ncbi:MAG: family 10 glycosylhydrolase [Thermoguttaceae bacterium]|nr:family 10 glycosylhydrolase [Thermoguttaceae bacterium]
MTYRTFIAILFAAVFSAVASANDGVYVLDNFTVETAPLWRSTSSLERVQSAKPEGAEFYVSFKDHPNADRVSIDRSFDKPIDLNEYSRFEVELELDNPETFSHCSFYFHSGNGWYGCITDIPPKRGVMTFRKADFHIEDSPIGWDKIDGVRISLWRCKNSNSRITYYSLRCFQEPILFLSVPNSEGVVPWIGTNNGRILQNILEEFELYADSITLPADAGAKPGEQKDSGCFKRLDHRCAVIVLYDKNLGSAQRSVLEAEAKKRGIPLLVLSSDLKKTPMEKSSFLEFLTKNEKLKATIRQFMLNQATIVAGQAVHNAQKTVAEMAQIEREKGFLEFIKACQERHDKELYKAAAPLRDSKTLPFRGWWNHSGFGAYKGDWERTATELEQAGFNAVFPNPIWSGEARYRSEIFPVSPEVDQYGDQLEECVKACHKHGIQVHVWKVNFNLKHRISQDMVEKYRQEKRLQIDAEGNEYPWLCPSNPKNIDLEVNAMMEIATKYPVDGVHFDYIRYEGMNYCFCDGCRERFEKSIGKKVESWPKDCLTGALKDKWTQWRADCITNIVRTTYHKIKAVRPDCKVSAAVFIHYPGIIKTIGQDWAAWANEGIVDFLCPMNYTLNAYSYGQFYNRQKEFVKPDFPLYPGVGEWKLTPDGTIQQLLKAQENGCPGFMIYDLTEDAAGRILPLLKKN